MTMSLTMIETDGDRFAFPAHWPVLESSGAAIVVPAIEPEGHLFRADVLLPSTLEEADRSDDVDGSMRPAGRSPRAVGLRSVHWWARPLHRHRPRDMVGGAIGGFAGLSQGEMAADFVGDATDVTWESIKNAGDVASDIGDKLKFW